MTLRLADPLPPVVRVGCSETAYLKYQGRPAETALECKAAYEEAKRRGGSTDYSSGATIIGSALGKGLAAGAIQSAYDSCLARVSALPGGGTSPAASTAPGSPAYAPPVRQCVPGASPFQGGAGYCGR